MRADNSESPQSETVSAPAAPSGVLSRSAGTLSVIAIGISAVISGHFSGWNFGLGVGGFGGILVAFALMAVLYLVLTLSLAEMSSAIPLAGGGFAFVRCAFGRTAAMIQGYLELLAYMFITAVSLYFASTYLQSAFSLPTNSSIPCWLLCYGLLLIGNVFGARSSFIVAAALTIVTLVLFVVLWLSAIPFADFGRWALNIGVGPDSRPVELPQGGGSVMPFGLVGAFGALPFALWLFAGIEILPLASEEVRLPRRDIPRGLLWTLAIVVVCALLTILATSSIGSEYVEGRHGAFSLATSSEAVLDSWKIVAGNTPVPELPFLGFIANIVSAYAFLYALGRRVFSMARNGYLPVFLAVTHARYRTPNRAMYAGAFAGLVVMIAIWIMFSPDRAGMMIGSTLLNAAVFATMLSLAAQLVAFIALRVKMPALLRPFRSPLGVSGAVVGLFIVAVTTWEQFQEPVFRGAAYVVAIALPLFLITRILRRGSIREAPEEAFALSQGQVLLRSGDDPIIASSSVNTPAPFWTPKKQEFAKSSLAFVLFIGFVAWYLLRETPTKLTTDLPARPLASERHCGLLRDRIPGEQQDFGPGLVLIPSAALYEVGRSANGAAVKSPVEPDQTPVHTVNLETPFALSACEITQEQYAAFADATDRSWIKVESNIGSTPVVGVTWDDAVAYAKWLSGKTGARYRLPSEAEWQYAAESSARDQGSGCDFSNTLETLRTESCVGFGDAPFEVARTTKNDLGLYDMIGNAAEWTADCYEPNYQKARDNGAAYDSWICEERVFRGGSWLTKAEPGLYRYRSRAPGDYRDYFLGFRLVRELSKEDIAEFDRVRTPQQQSK